MKYATYDEIGMDYNSTRKADPYLLSRMYHFLDPSPTGKYLDIGCGTGNYTISLQRKGMDMIGIDPSLEMLSKARLRNPNGEWLQGLAEKLVLENNSMDGILASLTMHHWKDLNQGFSEINRVLKAEGSFVMFTATPAQMKGYWLWHYFPQMLEDSCPVMPTFEKIEKCLAQNDLKIDQVEKYFIKDDLQDMFLYVGKNRPKLYFKPEVRSGISSFSALSNKAEVESGLKKLENDIVSGEIKKVMEQYESQDGDYLFITAKK